MRNKERIKVTVLPSGLWRCRGWHPEKSGWRKTSVYGAGGLWMATNHIRGCHVSEA